MKIYGLKNCDSCRKARKALPQAELSDVREQPMPDAVLAAAYEAFGETLLNTRSTTWRGLSQEDKQSPPLELIRAHPALMKRPLIDADGTLYLGWSADVQAALA